MKHLTIHYRRSFVLTLAALFASLCLIGTTPAFARDDDRNNNGNDRQHSDSHHNRGHWGDHKGARVWINI